MNLAYRGIAYHSEVSELNSSDTPITVCYRGTTMSYRPHLSTASETQVGLRYRGISYLKH